MKIRSRGTSALALALLVAVVALPQSAGAAAQPAQPAIAPIAGVQWGPCPPPPPGVPDGGQQCATVRVPMDYGAPGGRTLGIAVSRVPAADPALRRGVLLLNPGGPGGPGVDLPRFLGPLMVQDIRNRYDLIGFDPRFIGRSEAVACGLPTGSAVQLERVLTWPLPGGVPENAALGRDTANRCARNAGGVLPFMTTANTARDMDMIRQALGEQKISYLGYSYGTYLGAVYASLFPQRTDRFVLDSVVNAKWVWRDQFRAFGPANEQRFPDFTNWAAARDDTFHLGATSEEVRRTFFRLAARLDGDPIVLPDGLAFTGNIFREITRSRIYYDAAFAGLATV